jgi:hypothetical protein
VSNAVPSDGEQAPRRGVVRRGIEGFRDTDATPFPVASAIVEPETLAPIARKATRFKQTEAEALLGLSETQFPLWIIPGPNRCDGYVRLIY